MTVGMSAPPIGMISSTPKARPSTAMIGTIQSAFGLNTSTTTRTAPAPRIAKLMTFWPG